jgi:enamine deaminase RidA (YjgF/YER057c/UK114 family)
MSEIEANLAALGITLPAPAAPVANYVPYVITGNLLVISGQICFGLDGKLADTHKGKLGAEIFNEAGLEAARLCAVNVLAQAKANQALRPPRRLHQRRPAFLRPARHHERRL